MIVPLTAACIAMAAALLHVPESALWTILKVEAGRVGACTAQTNGTHDCGPAQINVETWAPTFSSVLGRSIESVSRSIENDGCFNVWAAAYVLRVKLAEARGDLWDAAGRYNSATKWRELAYQTRLHAAYEISYGLASGERGEVALKVRDGRGR